MAAPLSRSSGGYRRRHLLPMAVLVLVLAVASVFAWVVVFTNTSASAVTECNPPPVPGGAVQPRNALDETAAAAPGDTQVQVLNGAGQRGQANLASVELGELGIAEAAGPDNDPVYPALDLECVGQIRYGPEGESAARTLSLVVPCAELVADGRESADVSFSLGSEFRDVTADQAVGDALRGLAQGAESGAPVPGTEPDSLTALREVDCST